MCQEEITGKYKNLGGVTGDCHWECSEGPAWEAFLERERNPTKARFTGWTLDCLHKHVRSIAINFFRCHSEELQLRVETYNFDNETRYRVVVVFVHEDAKGRKYEADMDVGESQLVRYFQEGPISGDGSSLEEAIVVTFLGLKREVEAAIRNLMEGLGDMPSEEAIDEALKRNLS